MKYSIAILLFFGLTASNLRSQNENSIRSLIPGSNQIGNWSVKDSMSVYSDKDLYKYINGGADLYLEFGFNQVVSCFYMNPLASKIHIEVYEMVDSKAAYGIYTNNSSAIGKPIDLGAEAIQYDYYLHFWKSKYYVRCTSFIKNPGVIDTLKVFAGFIADKIEGKSSRPEIMDAFKNLGYEFKGVKYYRGQLGLRNIYNFSHGSVAGFKEGISGRFDDNMAFVISYDDERSRREWFASLKGKMNMSSLFSDYTPAGEGFTVKDRMGTILTFKPSGTYVLVIKGMDPDQAGQLFEEMEVNLNH